MLLHCCHLFGKGEASQPWGTSSFNSLHPLIALCCQHLLQCHQLYVIKVDLRQSILTPIELSVDLVLMYCNSSTHYWQWSPRTLRGSGLGIVLFHDIPRFPGAGGRKHLFQLLSYHCCGVFQNCPSSHHKLDKRKNYVLPTSKVPQHELIPRHTVLHMQQMQCSCRCEQEI